MKRTNLRATTEAVTILGQQLAIARREHRRTAADVAERAGVDRKTLRRIERGDPEVGIGLYVEVANVLAVPLFGRTGRDLAELVARGERDLAMFPARIRPATVEVDDDF